MPRLAFPCFICKNLKLHFKFFFRPWKNAK
jgi:hypothetical protein